jgi:NADPH:quinone reductase-like Zn-dependent oxidoreductase
MALQGVRDDGHVQSGQRVLINGAGGGVGTFPVQLAKTFGAEVTAVDSTAKLDMIRSIGADAVIEYTREDFAKNGQRYDLIVDCTARRSVFAIRRFLTPSGIYVVVGGSGSPILQTLLLGRLIRATAGQTIGLMLARSNHDIGYLSELLDSGKIAPVIDRIYPLREAPDAFRRIGEGRALGKLVITMTGEG